MNWHGRVGEIQEVLRDENGVSFEWKISKIFSMPEKVGRVNFSPELNFLESEWHLGIYQNSEAETREWIGIELWRSLESSQKPVRFSLGVTKADGTEEQIYRAQLFPEKCRFFSVKQFLHRSYLLNHKSYLAPSDALTVSCTLWKDEPSSVEGESTASTESETEDLEACAIAEEAAKLIDHIGKTLVSRETQTEDDPNSGPSKQEGPYFDKEGKTLVSRKTQTDDEPTGGRSKQERAYLDKEAKSSASRETQTEAVEGATARDDELGRLDMEGISVLRNHFRDLLLSGDDHDVIIKIKDKEFKAHKNVLRARSPVFAAMFKYKMKESTDGSIEIDDCDADAFGEFLQYVYTGMVQDLSPNKAIGLYYVGDKYDFPRLKAICVEFLKSSLSRTQICHIITLAIRYNEDDLLERAMAFFSEYLEEIMNTEEWESFLADNPVLSNKLLLKALKGVLKKPE